MTATAAEALELALWLHRAPARRAALLGRPLPDGIGQLLRVASGARDQVAAAATITGVDEATVLEAVRFYVQQVMFHEDADAYRVLGLRPGDSQERAREHHRLLQLWLHPDRAGQDAWDSVYATRINQAWGQLRTSQGRAAYDAAVVADAGGRGRHAGEPLPAARPIPQAVVHGPRTRSRNLTLVVLLGCAGLLVLIAVRRETPPQWLEDHAPVVAADALPGVVAPAAMPGAVLADAGPLPPEPALPSPGPAPVAAQAVGSPPPTVPPVVSARGADVRLPAAPAEVPDTVPQAPVRSVAVASLAPAPPPATSAPAPALQVASAVVPAAQAAVVSAPAAQRVAPIQVPDAFDRMAEAQARTRAVLAYLRDPDAGSPPVWNDVGTMQHAAAIRAALHGRQAVRRGAPVELQAPQWRLSADGARLESRYRAGAEQGRLDLAFTWRENQFLVTGIALDPDA